LTRKATIPSLFSILLSLPSFAQDEPKDNYKIKEQGMKSGFDVK